MIGHTPRLPDEGAVMTKHDGDFPMKDLRPGDVYRLTATGMPRSLVSIHQPTARHMLQVTFVSKNLIKPAMLSYPRKQMVHLVKRKDTE